MTGLLLHQVELSDGRRADCRIRDATVKEIGTQLRPFPDEAVVEGRNGAVIPGLADHHLHLAGMAALATSLDISAVKGDNIATVLTSAAPGPDGWIRAVGYDEAHGDIDREVLDRWRPDVPVRVQHRSGALWVLNSMGLSRVAAEAAHHPGIEREASGRLTGKLWRADDWLRGAVTAVEPSLAAIGILLATYGVTHVSDATPGNTHGLVIADAAARGDLPQKVQIMASAPGGPLPHRVTLGPRKIVIPDHRPPDFDSLVEEIAAAHEAARAVALHCVTRTALAVALAALDTAGGKAGDRIEHCAVADTAAARLLAERGIRVITQPTLFARRGDAYWDRSEPSDRPDLWRYAGLLRAGVRVAPSSDAPYGDPDPWACLQAARDRTTSSGLVFGHAERVPTAITLRGFLSRLDDPGGLPRRVRPGSAADLVLLDRPFAEVLAEPDASCVRATIIDGRIVHQR
ncbi:MAG: amidohydrolase family protein [Actinophytocola sp.]|nr:amidohydrolase family protein [Actinophytocola sp.]